MRGELFELGGPAPGDELVDPGYETPDDPCDGLDNDVDGEVDEGCYCSLGEHQPCFSGDPDHAGIGACRQLGVQRCVEAGGDFALGRWSTCSGSGQVTPEVCGNAEDEDCDGFPAPCQNDDITGLPCHPGESASCYDGAPGTLGVGACTAGLRTCDGDVWGPCENAILPADEVCQNGVDEDCDGSDAGC